jgi:ornithine cyclodeaminase/alanine dehydrogenase-like protein (mu-crystallin family)
VLYLSDDEAIRHIGPADARRVVLGAMVAHCMGRASLSSPPGLTVEGGSDTRFHVKGAILCSADVVGIRLGGFPVQDPDGERLMLLLLCDAHTSRPLALIEFEGLSSIRVATAVAVCIERLRASSARTLAVLGAGRLARAAIAAIQALTPFEHVRVASRSVDSALRLQASLSSDGVVGVVPATDPREACAQADVILTLTSADQPLVRAAWCRPGSLLVSAGGRQECDPDAILGADSVFVDDWELCSRIGDIAPLCKSGRLTRDEIAGTIGEVLAGRIPGRRCDTDRIVAVPQGLAVLDVALGHLALVRATEHGLGLSLPAR